MKHYYLFIYPVFFWSIAIVAGKFANPALVFDDLFVKQCMFQVQAEDYEVFSNEQRRADLGEKVMEALRYLAEVWDELLAVKEEQDLSNLRRSLNDILALVSLPEPEEILTEPFEFGWEEFAEQALFPE